MKMAFYVSPDIPTDIGDTDARNQYLPEPGINALAKQVLRVSEITCVPTYERVGGIVLPGVPRDYGYSYGQHFPTIMYTGIPREAPDIQRSTAAFTKSLQAAANPLPTTAATGIHGPLRAPGINEGL